MAKFQGSLPILTKCFTKLLRGGNLQDSAGEQPTVLSSPQLLLSMSMSCVKL
jgi:hypothetical protein